MTAASAEPRRPLITVQLCTYNRHALLGPVLDALFHQDLDPNDYEIVLVDDGSTDGTYEEILQHVRPTCGFHLVRQRNAGLARGRNVGIERARGEIILFMDDDVLATPKLLSTHIRFHREHRRSICRGVAINVESFDNLPPPKYSLRNYSGAYFWTTNVSVPLALLNEAGRFDERFREYGWEDLELGFRLRRKKIPSLLARDAVVYHFKPTLAPAQFARAARQARAQARTARQFLAKHPHWRIALATGLIAPLLWWSTVARSAGWPALLERIASPGQDENRWPMGLRRWAAERFARSEYFDELTVDARSTATKDSS
ncbi:MAG TPA: glycosyltransferase family A protein [Candidatus Acidoferrales bacterium]|nr:glycosyltransferase family A protein [Candidatus Acidoferrales bacterium]